MIQLPATHAVGIDGYTPAGVLPHDECCPPRLCNIDPDQIVCNLIQQLPRGPLWDRAKAEALTKYSRRNIAGGCTDDTDCAITCASVVDHAVYTAHRLIEALFGPLATALRESSPFSAHDTLDDWLLRFGWQDCYSCACHDDGVAHPSPIEVMQGGSPSCALPSYPADLALAVKRNIVVALARMAVGPRRNLAALNFVIAPLGAQIIPICYRDLTLDPTVCNNDDGTTLCPGPELPDYCPPPAIDVYYCEDHDACPGHDTLGRRCAPIMRQWTFCVSPTTDVIEAAFPADCYAERHRDVRAHPRMIQAYYEPSETKGDPEGLPERIFPGVMAAHCIVKAMMPRGAKIKLNLCI